MFRLAELLDAGVYSLTWNEARDSLITHDRFASVEDWDQRTAVERLRLQQRRADYKKRRAHYRKQRRIRFMQNIHLTNMGSTPTMGTLGYVSSGHRQSMTALRRRYRQRPQLPSVAQHGDL